jgi:capsular polysaccharide transport system permease protein
MSNIQEFNTEGRLRVLESFRDGAAGQAGGQPVDWRLRLRAAAHRHRWFLTTAVLPIVVAALYFFVVASDQYVSEARFIVRKANGEASSPLGGLLQTAGLAPTQENAAAVQDFLTSRDAVRAIENTTGKGPGLRVILSRPEADFINRFPRFFGGDSFEQLYKRFEDFVTVTLDSSSGITTLKVHAFRPGDSHAVAAALLNAGERLVNQLNDRAERDLLALARSEVRRAEQEVLDSQARITAYRQNNQLLDPKSGSAPLIELVGKLSADLAATQAQLGQLEAASPQSPQIDPLRARVAALRTQIDRERGRITGGDGSMAAKISGYERLYLQRQFADKALTSAMSSLEQARVKAQRERIYIEQIVQPNLADYPLYPRRLFSFLATAATVLMLYGIGKLVSSSVKEHVGR